METLPARFDSYLYLAASSFYGLPQNNEYTFSQTDKINPTTGKPYLTAMPPGIAAKSGKASWTPINRPAAGAARNQYGPKKPTNADIETVFNVCIDFEYPADPTLAHQIGIELAEILVEQGLAESGLPVEDSGAGSHIVIPIVPIQTREHGGGELVNRSIAEIVHQFIEPEFNRLAEKYGLAGKIKVEGYDISRILSAPGTFRPGGSKPNEVDYLQDGYLRCWLPPFTGDNYPTRNESEALSALIKAVCINLEAEKEAQERIAANPVVLNQSSNGKHQISVADWLNDYFSRCRKTGDRSHDFHALVTACYLRFDAKQTEAFAGIIDGLTGGKYGKRAGAEVLRSLKKAERLPKLSREEWYAAQAYIYEPGIIKVKNGATATTSTNEVAPPDEPPTPPAGTTHEPFKQHHLTDLGNTRRFVERKGQDVRFVRELGFLCWNGTNWERDTTGMAKRLAKQTVGTIYSEAGQIEDADKRKEVAAWANKSENSGKLEAMLSLAESELEIVARTDDFDKDPMLLNCLNGTVDLRSGHLRPHRREDLITKLVPVEYHPDASAPTWVTFINRIMGNNEHLVSFVQRALGYSLTGDISEHVLFFCYGTGANGKTTLLDVIAHIMGDYYRPSDFTTFLENNARNGSASPDLARLAGARFVTASEPDPGKRLAEGVLKQLTGGDRITAAYKYKDHFEFTPDLKLWIAANHKPAIRGQDEGIWRRIRLIPFEVTIPPAERDRKLVKKLIAEAPGILAWLVQGCLLWQFEGLGTPKEVMEATEAYRNESDILRDFLSDCCVTGAGKKVLTSELYKAYTRWCDDTGERPIGKKNFSSSLAERGIASRPGNRNKYTYYGLELVEKPEISLDDMGWND